MLSHHQHPNKPPGGQRIPRIYKNAPCVCWDLTGTQGTVELKHFLMHPFYRSLSLSPYCLLPSSRYPFIFPESTSCFCHCQLWHKTFYSSHMYLDPTAPNYARQQMEGATWFTARLHSSKTALMAYQRKLRWDKWRLHCMGLEKETWVIIASSKLCGRMCIMSALKLQHT